MFDEKVALRERGAGSPPYIYFNESQNDLQVLLYISEQ